MEDWSKYFATQSAVTGPGRYKDLYDNLPDEIPALCRVVQGLLLHLHWAQAYGVNLPDQRKTEVKLRRVTRQLAHILELDNSPLITARPLEKRLVGTCRDYAALLTSFLRHKGIPARMRVGFATYFTPGRYEDHYLCQYWNKSENRWILVDAQLDDFQCRALKISFDPCDLPEGLFWPGGKAWHQCRQGQVDPETFGIFDIQGLWFIGCDLIFDALALNKIESHPWDIWPLTPEYRQKEFHGQYLFIMDHIADLTGRLAPGFAEVRLFYQTEKKLQPPPDWEP
jgi:hypothetical protein